MRFETINSVAFTESSGQTTITRNILPSREPRDTSLDTAKKDGMDMISTAHLALLERVA